MDDPITREEHGESQKRMETEDDRQDCRIEIMEKRMEQIGE